MLNLCGIVVAILKMATGRNFSMSGINLGHHYVTRFPYQMMFMSLKSNMMDATSGAGTAYASGAPDFFSFLCSVL
jgi:hypothetical protein